MNYSEFNDENDFSAIHFYSDIKYNPRQLGSSLPVNLSHSNYVTNSKRILHIAIKLNLNIAICINIIEEIDLSQSDDHMINELLDKYNKRMELIEKNEQNLQNNLISSFKQSLSKMKRRNSDDHYKNKSPFKQDFLNNSYTIEISEKIPSLTNDICAICFDSLTSQNRQILFCRHKFCQNCIFEYFQNKILNANISYFPCPDEHCNYIFPESEILKYISNNKIILEKYYKFKKIQEISKNPNAKWCIAPGCEEIIIKSPNMLYMKCKCGQEICFKCGNAWHNDLDCDQAMDVDYQNYIKKAKFKYCARCNSIIEKNGGCNHMTCTRCDYEFCWICGKPFKKNHYSIWNLNGCPGMQFIENIDNLTKTRKVFIYLKSLILIILIIIFGIVFGPLVFIGACLFSPLLFYFGNKSRKLNCCNFFICLGLIIIGIIIIPITLIVGFISLIYEIYKRI